MFKHFPPLRFLMLVLVSASASLAQADAHLRIRDILTLVPATESKPRAREYHAATQLANGNTFYHGGENPGTVTFFDDAFEAALTDDLAVSVTGFYKRKPAPSGRSRHGVAGTNNGAVLFGGWDNNGLRGDTWIWDIITSSWNELLIQGPSPRAEFHMLELPSIQKVLLFGGVADQNYTNFLGDTWLFDPMSMTWEELQIPGPSARSDGEIAYVPGLGAVLFGGASSQFYNDLWAFDGAQWSQLSPVHQPLARFGHFMYWDEARGQLIMGGGVGDAGGGFGMIVDDVWVYHEGDWLPSNATAPRRVGATVTYDPNQECGLMIGGTDWLMTYGDSHVICSESPATIVPLGVGCPGSNGIPTLSAVPGSRPWIGDTFKAELGNLPPGNGMAYVTLGFSKDNWGGIPLPLNLSQFGMWNCFAYGSVDFSFLILIAGASAEWQLQIPDLATLVGLELVLGMLATEPGVNPFGAVTSNALEIGIGWR